MLLFGFFDGFFFSFFLLFVLFALAACWLGRMAFGNPTKAMNWAKTLFAALCDCAGTKEGHGK